MSADRPHPLAGRRVLVVEDEALVAMLVEDLLIELGCDVVDVAGTLEEGLAIAEARLDQLDGAVLDINLGGVKVFPIADLLLAKGVRFVFSTGYGAAAIAAPYDQYPVIAKPYLMDTLEETLVTALG